MYKYPQVQAHAGEDVVSIDCWINARNLTQLINPIRSDFVLVQLHWFISNAMIENTDSIHLPPDAIEVAAFCNAQNN